jgi:hypothetical protein
MISLKSPDGYFQGILFSVFIRIAACKDLISTVTYYPNSYHTYICQMKSFCLLYEGSVMFVFVQSLVVSNQRLLNWYVLFHR